VIEVGDRVAFELSSVFLPRREDVTAAFSLDPHVEGAVIGFSDSGSARRAFVVVEVIRRLTVVVPVDQVRLAEPGPETPRSGRC
jgi:hypothetical protein